MLPLLQLFSAPVFCFHLFPPLFFTPPSLSPPLSPPPSPLPHHFLTQCSGGVP